MQATRTLLAQRQPMIRFLGKRTTPQKIDHTPHPHPASPSSTLPSSFAAYRQKAQQHGPLNSSFAQASSASLVGGRIGGQPGASLGSIAPTQGQFFDRSELPERFRRLAWSEVEIEAVESGGASLV